MTQKEQLRALVQKMIVEAKTSERIKAIDEAGDIAANEAKIARIQKEAKNADNVKKLMEKVNLSHYIGEKLFEKVMQEMDKSIQEYEGARLELEEKMSGPKDDNKKDKNKKAEVLETEESLITERKITVVINYNTDEDDIRYIAGILKDAGILADVKAGIDSEEVEITIEKSDLKKAKQALSKNGFELAESKEEVLEASDKDSEKLERYKGYTYTLDGAIVKPEINFYDNLLKAELNGRFYNLGMPVDGNVELKLQR
jgi:hypothetical protein